MGIFDSLNILFAVSNPRILVHLMGVVRAAKDRGHDVVIFFNEESVKLLIQYPLLSKLGVELLACQTMCKFVGIKEEHLIPGARMTSMAEMVMMMEEKDRTLFLG
jgi:peroxiredoxin family protein